MPEELLNRADRRPLNRQPGRKLCRIESDDREARGGEENAAYFGCDPEDLPATGTVHGGGPTAAQSCSGEDQGDSG